MKSLLLVVLLTAPALAETSDAPWAAGVGAGAYIRDQASGSRTPTLDIRGTVTRRFTRVVRLTLDYDFSFLATGPVVTSFSHYHHLQLRPELALPVGAHAFYLALGPAAQLTLTQFKENGATLYNQTTLVPGASAGVGFDAHIRSIILRTGVDVLWRPNRIDLLAGLTLLFPLGGGK
ncbi:MAG: hypothetical protein ACT4TC_20745 [Myxococcaceae bacterium]